MTDPYQTVQPMSPSDEKLWATLIHVGGILFGLWPAVIGYFVLKDRGPFVRAHVTTALNFQLTLLIAFAVGFVTMFILIGFFVLAAAGILSLVFSIMAALAANEGRLYTYPLTIEFVK